MRGWGAGRWIHFVEMVHGGAYAGVYAGHRCQPSIAQSSEPSIIRPGSDIGS